MVLVCVVLFGMWFRGWIRAEGYGRMICDKGGVRGKGEVVRDVEGGLLCEGRGVSE